VARAIPGLVVAHDRTAGLLSAAWWAGDLVDRTPHHEGVKSWHALIDWLRELDVAGERVTQLHLWSHGNARGPLIAGEHPTDDQLRQIAIVAPSLELVWFRSCDVGKRPSNVARMVGLLDCAVACHCVVVAAGERDLRGWLAKLLPWRLRLAPWHQGRIVALRPGEVPAWDPNDPEIRGCPTTAMFVPAHAFTHSRAV